MDWKSMQDKFPWSVVLLLGGGFALAAGVKASGLSQMIGELLSKLDVLPTVVIQLLCVVITMFITNICSNTVTATIFTPIVAELGVNLEMHPLDFVLPVVLACSYAFVLPVGTPPNAIVFASGMLTVFDMMLAGLLVTVVGVFVIVCNQLTYARLVFSLDTFPDWAANFTRLANDTKCPVCPGHVLSTTTTIITTTNATVSLLANTAAEALLRL